MTQHLYQDNLTEFKGIGYWEKTFSEQLAAGGGKVAEQPNLFTKKFGAGPDEWPVEAGRYRLIWMPGCPHAQKVVITRKLLGLDSVISLGTTGIYRSDLGWVFSDDPGEVDPVLGIHYLHDVYTKEAPDYKWRSTVPIIVEEKTGRGVNNDHFWLSVYLNTAFEPLHAPDAPDLYPRHLAKEIDALNRFLYERINTGVYRCGFARTQEDYEQAYDAFFAAMDILDEHLAKRRFLFGDYVTDSDIRLFPTLARFHATYYQVFRANRTRLSEFENLWPYARDLYRIPAVRETTDFELYKRHYQLSPHLRPLFGNVHGLLSKGPSHKGWDAPHGREKLSKGDGIWLRKTR